MTKLPSLSKKEAVILELLLARGEMYGLEMVNASDKVGRGTIYVTLSRMAEKGFVASRAVPDPEVGGAPRRLYTVTGVGQRVFSAWQMYHSAMTEGFAV